jgi:hypothetical protein
MSASTECSDNANFINKLMKLVGANPTHVSSFLSVNSVWVPCWICKRDFVVADVSVALLFWWMQQMSTPWIHDNSVMDALKKMVKTIKCLGKIN